MCVMFVNKRHWLNTCFFSNDWSPSIPSPVVKLYESWSSVLPQFIKDNILDQLILPKVASAISKWSPKRDEFSLQSMVFPWLPHVGLRMEAFVDEARRKIKSMLRSWSPNEGVPKDMLPWKDVGPLLSFVPSPY
jgi:tuftelin-interacting protein 11